MAIPAYLSIHIITIKSQIDGANVANIGNLSEFVNQQINEILGRIEYNPTIVAEADKLAHVTALIVTDNASESSKQMAALAIASFENSLKSAKPNKTTKMLRID